jgi:hypothetical protein
VGESVSEFVGVARKAVCARAAGTRSREPPHAGRATLVAHATATAHASREFPDTLLLEIQH